LLPSEISVTLAIVSAREKVDVNVRLPQFVGASEQIPVELPFGGGPRLSWQRAGPHIKMLSRDENRAPPATGWPALQRKIDYLVMWIFLPKFSKVVFKAASLRTKFFDGGFAFCLAIASGKTADFKPQKAGLKIFV
jgi:hypothetical protein